MLNTREVLTRDAWGWALVHLAELFFKRLHDGQDSGQWGCGSKVCCKLLGEEAWNYDPYVSVCPMTCCKIVNRSPNFSISVAFGFLEPMIGASDRHVKLVCEVEGQKI